jgi:adenylate cyclase
MFQDAQSILDRLFQAALPAHQQADLALALQSGDRNLAMQAARLLRQLSVVAEVSRLAASNTGLTGLLTRLMGLIVDVLEADRATLFLYDPETGELFSRVLRGDGVSEIRIPCDRGIAGAVFKSGQGEIIADAYADTRFNTAIDRQTGYRTQTILTVPVRTPGGEVIGVAQVLNTHKGSFSDDDQALLERITTQAAAVLEHARLVEKLERQRQQETQLLEIAEMISTELQIDVLLDKVIKAVARLLDAERATLFLHDPVSDELWSRVAQGGEAIKIRIPASAGLAGAAFSSGAVLNIPDCYADPRFNAEIDRKSGYKTRNMLCLPFVDRQGIPLGVVQVLNKRGGAFEVYDEKHLRAFTAQVTIAIQNAQLFSDVLDLKNYNDSILRSLTNGVVTLDRDNIVVKANEAACRILNRVADEIVGRSASVVFHNKNGWIVKSLDYVRNTSGQDFHADTDYYHDNGAATAVNLSVVPLFAVTGVRQSNATQMGSMLVFEDITREKRVRATMSRYMAKEVLDRLLEVGDDALKGSVQESTILFSDLRRFTALSESMSATETVQTLNEYFTAMVDVILEYGGILDKYIGDAIMAIFGAPVQDPYDADNALSVATEMMVALRALNHRRAERGQPTLAVGVGLATGDVLAGSIGSTKRMDYTVIGDSVNLAARLESANKFYGTDILVAGSTVEKLKRRKKLRPVDIIRVKGKTQAVPVFESLDHLDHHTAPGLRDALPYYLEGIEYYRARNFHKALSQFEQAVLRRPLDGPGRVYLNRCRHYLDYPPSEGWDGVWTLTEK